MARSNPYALYFDGIDDFLSAVTFSSAIRTLEFWFETPIAYMTGNEEGGNFFQFDSYLQALSLGKTERSGRDNITATIYLRQFSSGHSRYMYWYTTAPVTAGIHHLAVVWNSGTDINFILDGQPVPMTKNPNNLGYRTRLELNDTAYAPYIYNRFHGTMDEIRVWSTVRTLEEIQENMHKSLKGDEPGLMLYWRFDEGSGNTVTDSSPSGLNATITGATWVPGLVDLEGLAPPGRVDISAVLGGSASMSVGKADRIRGLSAHLTGAATATGGTPIRIRGLTANLEGAGTTNIRMNLIAALKAHLQGQATLKSNILVLFVPEGVYVIDADEIFAKDQPSRGQVVANHIEVWVNPLKPVDEPEEVYRSKDPITIPAGETKTITIRFDEVPVTEPAVALEEAGVNLSIVDTKYYAWGADVTIKNAGSGVQTCRIVATGKPLKVQGREVVVKRDEVSIQENGLKKYTFDNPLVQDRATAELIADKLLSFANAKRDVVIEWRGDPALQLADVVMIPEYQRKGLDQRGIFYVTKQELEFDGGLRAKLEGRKM